MRENTRALEVCTADYCSRANKIPGFIQERILCVKRAKAKAKAEECTDPILAARKEILRTKLANI